MRDPLKVPVAGHDEAADLLTTLQEQALSLSTAESLTGGLLGAAITAVPGASAVYLGGVVTYATSLKSTLLGVPDAVVQHEGVVSAPCAEAMAVGVRRLTVADLGVAVTGVAGPEPQEGKSPGTVFVAVATPDRTVVEELRLTGDREAIRHATVRAALRLALEALDAV